MGALGNLIPLIILFVFVGAFAFVGYQVRHHSQISLSALHLPITRLTHWQQMYVWTNDLADQGKKKMEKKNVKFSKDGMQVGVKEISEEDYADKTQRCVGIPIPYAAHTFPHAGQLLSTHL